MTDEEYDEAVRLWGDAHASPYDAQEFHRLAPAMYGKLLAHINALTAQLDEARAECERLQSDAALGRAVREVMCDHLGFTEERHWPIVFRHWLEEPRRVGCSVGDFHGEFLRDLADLIEQHPPVDTVPQEDA